MLDRRTFLGLGLASVASVVMAGRVFVASVVVVRMGILQFGTVQWVDWMQRMGSRYTASHRDSIRFAVPPRQ